MTTATSQLVCVKGPGRVQCPGRPIVRYAVGPACSAHLVPGAEILDWLYDDGVAELAGAVAGPGDPVRDERLIAALGLKLPDPGRPRAAQHADADRGEANAARLVRYKAGTIRHRVLAHLVEAGARGTTAIEAWEWYRGAHSAMTERYSVAPRLSELVADGWAVKTGATRNVRGAGYPPEEVYVLSPRGRRQLGVAW